MPGGHLRFIAPYMLNCARHNNKAMPSIFGRNYHTPLNFSPQASALAIFILSVCLTWNRLGSLATSPDIARARYNMLQMTNNSIYFGTAHLFALLLYSSARMPRQYALQCSTSSWGSTQIHRQIWSYGRPFCYSIMIGMHL
jgi:hypothetical protein